MNYLIFKSNKNPVLFSTIPLLFYNKYLEVNLNYKNLKIEDIC